MNSQIINPLIHRFKFITTLSQFLLRILTLAYFSIKRLKAIELSIILYVIFSLLVIIISFNRLNNIGFHLLFRFVTLFIIGILALGKKEFKPGKWLSFVRLVWPLLLLSYFYSETDYLNNLIITNNLDFYFAQLEENIFGLQPALVFSSIIQTSFFAELMYAGYFSYYILIIAIPIVLFLKRTRAVAEQAVFIMVNSFLIYYIIFIFIPVAGPQFYFENSTQDIPGGYIFGFLIRTIQQMGEAPTAAFPSSHVSICLMLVWITYKYWKTALKVVIPISVLLILSTVYLKAHYAIDVLAAFITTPIIYLLSIKMYRFFYFKLNFYELDNNRS